MLGLNLFSLFYLCFLLKWERISVQILGFLQESSKYCDFSLNTSYERSNLSEIPGLL